MASSLLGSMGPVLTNGGLVLMVRGGFAAVMVGILLFEFNSVCIITLSRNLINELRIARNPHFFCPFMSKKIIAQSICAHTNISVRDAETLAAVVLDTVRDRILKDGSIRLPGIGMLSMVHRPERRGRNPRTHEEFVTPARKAIRFKASTLLIDRINAEAS